MGDYCDLECLDKGKKKKKEAKKPMEFVGPVKIVLVEDTFIEYVSKTCQAAVVTLAHFFMGAGVMTVLYFTLAFKLHCTMNLHIFFNTLGCQYCLISAQYMNSDKNLASIPMNKNTRRTQCIILSISGFCMFFVSNAVLFVVYGTYFHKPNMHASFGLLNFIVMIIYLPTICFPFVTDPDTRTTLDNLAYIWEMLTILCNITSALAFITGLFEPVLLNWFPHRHCVYFLILFCIFNNIVALKLSIMKIYTLIKNA